MGDLKLKFLIFVAILITTFLFGIAKTFAQEYQIDYETERRIQELKTLLKEYEKKKQEIEQLLLKLEEKEKKLEEKESKMETLAQEVKETKEEIAQKNKDLEKIIKYLKDLKINGLWYISYWNGEGKGVGGSAGDGKVRSRTAIKRGYLRFTKSILPWFDAHITFDVTQVKDKSNFDGSLAVRLKYIFGKFKFPDMGFLTKPFLEFGLVHFPWLDYEEHVNWYRCQDTMFTERNGLYNSADWGITFTSLLGGEMPEEYKKRVNSHYAGRYGSISMGVYTGAGYHGHEKNNNKPFEARITIRPFPDILPGLQFSYFGIWGKGNKEENPPNWRVNLLFASYEHEYFTATAQYYWGESNFKGTDDYDKDGYSFFLELKPYAFSNLPVSIIGRYDYFDQNDDQDDLDDGVVDESRRYIIGIAYHIDKPHKSMFLLDYDYVDYEDKLLDNDNRVQFTLQVKF